MILLRNKLYSSTEPEPYKKFGDRLKSSAEMGLVMGGRKGAIKGNLIGGTLTGLPWAISYWKHTSKNAVDSRNRESKEERDYVNSCRDFDDIKTLPNYLRHLSFLVSKGLLPKDYLDFVRLTFIYADKYKIHFMNKIDFSRYEDIKQETRPGLINISKLACFYTNPQYPKTLQLHTSSKIYEVLDDYMGVQKFKTIKEAITYISEDCKDSEMQKLFNYLKQKL